MGELIRRNVAAEPQAFSGERLTGAMSGQIEIEHYHRYLLAREFCRGRDVLDVAAGEGYGTALLAQIARSAVGIEIDADTVAAARTAFQRPNLRYEQGDARCLPLPDASIDVAVSFETLEHLAEQDVFLSELRRVLRPGGLLIMSTPDRDAYSPVGTPPNTFHVLELTRAEFEALLQRHFAHSAVAAQRALIGSVILGAGQGTAVRSYEKRSDAVIEGSDNLSRAPYLVAFASDTALPPLPSSVYVYRGDVDTDTLARFAAEAGRRDAEAQVRAAAERAAEGAQREANAARVIAELELRAATAEHRAETAEHHAEAAERSAEAAERRGEAAERRAEAAEGRVEAAERSTQAAEHRADEAAAEVERVQRQAADTGWRLGAIEGSTTWRATRPLRNAGQRFPFLARNLRRGMKLAWWTVTLQLPRRYRMRRDVHHPALQATPTEPTEATAPRPGDINVPLSNEPTVSVIISTYGQVGLTLACLKSIADHAPRCPIEVMVVDDAYVGSEDVGVLRDVAGILFSRNASNLGFLLSCNQAARAAKGRYIYMLNNDTELQTGAIDALVDLLNARPDAGMAGSKLLYPDGLLQEAGAILWSDASGWNYGRGDDPWRPDYNYVREVDYCSGASIMVRRTLFESLGGFDEDFVPAYYEDADLAFRIRAQGSKVLYEPRSVVIHHEGMSHGTDVAQGVKAHQVTNRIRMVERWGALLARENFPNGQHVFRARDRARMRKVILIIDHYVPEPDRDAGSRSVMGIIDSLIDAGWVVKFWPDNRAYTPYTAALESRGVEVLDHRWSGDLGSWMREYGSELDHLLVNRPAIAADALPHLVCNTDAVLSFYGHDLHFIRLRRQAELEGNAELLREAAATERLERRVWRQFDVVIYPSAEEAATVSKMSPGTLASTIVLCGYDAFPARSSPPQAFSILFVAGFAHPPNVDAAVFLLQEVIPRLEREIGPVRVVLAGSNPTESVQALAGPNVEVTGYVTEEALGELYNQSRVAVVPLRFGAGVKGKVVEALSRGLPLVTTFIGAQGIVGLDEVVPVHDDVSGMVAALKLLLTDDAAWMAQSAAQMDFAQRFFSRAAVQRSVLSALEAGEAAIGPSSAPARVSPVKASGLAELCNL